jgi:hypothetical protein
MFLTVSLINNDSFYDYIVIAFIYVGRSKRLFIYLFIFCQVDVLGLIIEFSEVQLEQENCLF